MVDRIIAALITVGGMGFMNFIVTDQLGVIDIRHDNRTAVVAYSLLWSIFDYAIYLTVQTWLGRYHLSDHWRTAAALMITLLVAFLLTVIIARPLSRVVYWIYNHLSTGHQQVANFTSGTVFANKLMENNEATAYLYNSDHQPISFGKIELFSFDNDNNVEFSLVPLEDTKEQPSYDELTSEIGGEDFYKKYRPFVLVKPSQDLVAVICQC